MPEIERRVTAMEASREPWGDPDIQGSSRKAQNDILLVIDEDPMLQKMFLFNLLQHSVSVAHTGTTALEFIRQRKFDLVLLDLQLPDMSGLRVLMALRETHSQTELPVVMVSALSQSENVIQALEHGANDYITKPINFPEMRARVRAQLLRAAAIRENEERYALAVRGANDGLWDWNLNTDRIYFSSRWKSMLGWAENEISDHPDEWFKRVHPEDILRLKQEIANHLEGVTPHLENQHRLLHKDGTYRWMNVRGVTAQNAANSPVRMAGSHSNITHGKVADALTGLPNRALFLERLETCLERVKRQGGPIFAVLFLDLDRFKGINDSLGHPIGDQLLIAISRRLETCLRSEDTISRTESENLLARLGGDEFIILLECIQELSQASSVADRILKELRTPFNLDGNEVFTTASIGIALGTVGHEQAKDVLRDADTAMYEAKAQGKGRCEVFDSAMRDRMLARQQLEIELRRAVATQEFVVHYQPIFSLKSGQLSGFEALVRWQHPERGLLGPNEFISIAEETGLSLSLDQWVLRQATCQMKNWQNRHSNHDTLTISVNFSSRQFKQPDVVEQVSEVLTKTGLDGSSLELEITETQMMENRESVSSVLRALRALNIQLAIDDFGTGYSSLSYIQRFPVQRLKIDRSFVSRMCLEQEDRAIVQTIIALAHNLGLHLVAEGVETAEQLAQLKDLGCEYAQGYFFSEPVDAAAAEELIRRSEALSSSVNNQLGKCPEEVLTIKRLLDEIKDLQKKIEPAPPPDTPEELDQVSIPRKLKREATSADSEIESKERNGRLWEDLTKHFNEGRNYFAQGDFDRCAVLMGEILQHNPEHCQAIWYWNESQRRREEERLRDEVTIRLEDIKNDAVNSFDQERYRECVGIFDFLSQLESENHQWRQYLELSRQLILEKEPRDDCSVERGHHEDGVAEEYLSPTVGMWVTSEQKPTSQNTMPSAQLQEDRTLSESSVSMVLCSRPEHVSIAVAPVILAPSIERQVPARPSRLGALLLGIAASLLLGAFVIPHPAEKDGLPLTAAAQSIPISNLTTKNSEDQLQRTAMQSTREDLQPDTRQGVLTSGFRVDGLASDPSLDNPRQQDQRVFGHAARQTAINANAHQSDGSSITNNAKVIGIQNERIPQRPAWIGTAKTIEPKLGSARMPERITSLRSENQNLSLQPRIYSVIHNHVLGSCQGTLTIDGKSISFVSSSNARDEFKSSLSQIIGIEVGDTLKIKFENRTYHFKAVTSGGKEANRAEVDAIYRELTQFTSSDQKHSSEARANPTL